MKHMFLAALLLMFCAASLLAEQIIDEIKIVGTKRTRDKTVLTIIGFQAGDIWPDDGAEIIVQRLRAEGIFKDEISVDSEHAENRVSVTVYVEDQWTLYALPTAYGGGEWYVGGIIMENNFLGLNKMLFAEGGWGSSKKSIGLFYTDPSIFSSQWLLSAGIKYSNDSYDAKNSNGETVQTWKQEIQLFRIGAGYRFSDHFELINENDFNWILGSDHQDENIQKSYLRTGLQAEIDYQRYNRFFPSGFLVKGDLAAVIALSNRHSDFGFNAGGRYTWLPHENLRIMGKLGAGISNFSVTEQYELGGYYGTAGLPRGILTQHYYFADGTAEYRLPIDKWTWGFITVPAGFEMGTYKDHTGGWEFYQSIHLGLGFYLREITIPAVSTNIAWNFQTQRLQFSLAVGMSL